MTRTGKELEDYLSNHGQQDAVWVKVDDPDYPYRLKCWNCGQLDEMRSKTEELPKGYSTLCAKCFYTLPNLQI